MGIGQKSVYPDLEIKNSKFKIWLNWTAKCEILFPGLVLPVFFGGVAAVIFWSLYGLFSGATVVGTHPCSGDSMPFLTIGELASSLLIGIGGAEFLMTEANRRCSNNSLGRK